MAMRKWKGVGNVEYGFQYHFEERYKNLFYDLHGLEVEQWQ